MARPKEEGLTYFPLNCDNDEKLDALCAAYENDGFAVYINVLRAAYKTSTGELDISSSHTVKALARKSFVSTERWLEIIQVCVDLKLFEKESYEVKKNLTSNGIKRRLAKVEKDRREWRKRNKTRRKGEESLHVSKPRVTPDQPEVNTVETPTKETKTKKEIKRKKELYKLPSEGGNALPLKLSGFPEFGDAWEEWVKYRAHDLRKPLSAIGAKKQLDFLEEQPNPVAVIGKAIMSGWQGLFSIKDNGFTNAKHISEQLKRATVVVTTERISETRRHHQERHDRRNRVEGAAGPNEFSGVG